MWSSARRHTVAGIIVGVGILVLATACGTSTTISPNVTKVTNTNSVALAAGDARKKVTASCGSGEVLIGGGYYLFLTREGYAQQWITGSFPSDDTGTYSAAPTAWTAEAYAPPDGGVLFAYAYCLRTSFPLTVQATTRGASTVQVRGLTTLCPPNTTLTGGGFRAPNGAVQDSYPSDAATGWVMSTLPSGDLISPQLVNVYAVCITTAHLTHAPSSSSDLTIPGDPTPSQCFAVAGSQGTVQMCRVSEDAPGEVSCTSGQILAAGGYSGVQGNFYSDLPPGVSTSSPIPYGFLLYEDKLSNTGAWAITAWATQRILQGKAGASGSVRMWATCLYIQL